jgi:AraC-like DNA-binding protein
MHLTEAVYDLVDAAFWDMHYELEVGVVRRGTMRRHCGDWHDDLRPGDAWLCGMWEPHGFTVTERPCEVVALVVLPEFLADAGDGTYDWLLPFGVTASLRPRAGDHYRERLLRIASDLHSAWSRQEPERTQWLRTLLFELLLCLRDGWREPSGTDQLLSVRTYQRVAQAVRMVFESRGFVSVEEAGRCCGMSRNAFAASFKEVMAVSFATFALRYRLNGAAHQLVTTDLPLKAIAHEWGFADSSHLCKCFQGYAGMSPGKYRRAHASAIT